MTLYLISLGIQDKEDMSMKAYKTATKCSVLYLETYTSKGPTLKELQTFLKKKILPLERKDIEEQSDMLLKHAKKKTIGILIYGHALAATTHLGLLEECRRTKTPYEIIHGSSILTAVSVTGLSLYNFGKTTSIPFKHEHVEEPYNVLQKNLKNNYHTLFLLDLANNKYMDTREAITYLLRVEHQRNEHVLDANTFAIICGGLGSKHQVIKAGTLQQLQKKPLGVYPQVLIIPGTMHFVEEDYVKGFQDTRKG